MEDPMTATTTDLTATVDTWLRAYGEPDPAIRAELIAQVWAPEGVLVDPPFSGTGRDEIAGLVAAAQGQFPGHTFRRTSEIDAHHDLARYTWELVGPDGPRGAAGPAPAFLGGVGRPQLVAGSLGEPAPLAA